jgi:hypothetical protein
VSGLPKLAVGLALVPALGATGAGVFLGVELAGHTSPWVIEAVVQDVVHQDGQKVAACKSFASTRHERACFSWAWARARWTQPDPELGGPARDFWISAELCEDRGGARWARALGVGEQVELICRQDPIPGGPRGAWWCIRACDDADPRGATP